MCVATEEGLGMRESTAIDQGHVLLGKWRIGRRILMDDGFTMYSVRCCYCDVLARDDTPDSAPRRLPIFRILFSFLFFSLPCKIPSPSEILQYKSHAFYPQHIP